MDKLKKCCVCGDPITIGFLMPDGEYVCAYQPCCYCYCEDKGERIEIEEEQEDTQ